MNPAWGMALINKPPGITSFQALNLLKKQLATKKVGHCGTLDRFAQGMLIALTGPATRLAFLFNKMDKCYKARIVFGKQTDTLDPEGAVIETGGIPELKTIQASLPGFLGEIMQRPPVYSAVHVQGERSYKKARAGEEFELPEREIVLHDIRIDSWTPPFLELYINCSSGTYIRSLARDLGKTCGTCANLHNLERTSIGTFTLEQSFNYPNFDPQKDLLSPEGMLSHFNNVVCVQIEPGHRKRISHGGNLNAIMSSKSTQKDGLYALFCGQDLLGVCDLKAQKWSYKMTVPYQLS